MRKLLALTVATLLAGSLAACAGGSTADDEVRTVVTDFYAALAGSDFEKACSLVSSDAELDGFECEAALEAVEVLGEHEPADYGDFAIESVEISGDDAVVELRGGEGTSKLVNAVSGWRIIEDTSLGYGATLLAIGDIDNEADSLEDDLAAFEGPDVSDHLRCDYLLGSEYRFVGGGRLRNDGTEDARVKVTFTWMLLGSDPVKESKTVNVPAGRGRDVQVSLPATGDQIDAHQSAEGECRTNSVVLTD